MPSKHVQLVSAQPQQGRPPAVIRNILTSNLFVYYNLRKKCGVQVSEKYNSEICLVRLLFSESCPFLRGTYPGVIRCAKFLLLTSACKYARANERNRSFRSEGPKDRIGRNVVLTGLDGTGPARHGRQATGRVARLRACEERRIGDCKIGAGQGWQARVRQQIEAKTGAGPELHSGTEPQRGGILVTARSARGWSPLGGQGLRVPEWGRQRGRGDG